MEAISTYVFFDLETTGLPSETEVPGITELGIIAVKRRHFEDTEKKELRVQNRFLLCFNPGKIMNPDSKNLSGLSNDLLENEADFDGKACNAISSFLNCLQKPICLIAHNGFKFHFPVFKYYIEKQGCQLSPDIQCADSLYGFHDLLEAKKAGGEPPVINLGEKTFEQLIRRRYYDPKGHPGVSYELHEVYHREGENPHLERNRSQTQCEMMMEVAQGRPAQFGQWIDGHHCALSGVPVING